MLIGRLSVRGWSTTILRMVLICSLNPAAPKTAASLTPRKTVLLMLKAVFSIQSWKLPGPTVAWKGSLPWTTSRSMAPNCSLSSKMGSIEANMA